MAYSRLTEGYWQIWTMQPDGSGAKQITFSASDKRYPVWAENGMALYYRTNNNEAYSIKLDSGLESRLLGSFGLNGGVLPSPDGSKLVFPRYRFEPKDSSRLWLADSDGKNTVMLTHEGGMQYEPSWSPDGEQIAYVSTHGPRTAEIFVVDADGKNRCRLTNNEAHDFLPSFSPDGQYIAYTSDITGDYEIWLMSSDGSGKRQLTNNKGIDTRPCWSPDGSKIVFTSRRSGRLQLWIMNSDGSGIRELTKGQPATDPAWRKE
ncbi:MAG: TolB family protein [Planctomycetota bacterium]